MRMHKSVYGALDEYDKIITKVIPSPTKQNIQVPMEPTDFEQFIIGMVVVHTIPLCFWVIFKLLLFCTLYTPLAITT